MSQSRYRCYWTPEEDAELLRMLGEGCSDQTIAAAMGIAVARVRARRYRLNLNSPVLPGRKPRANHAEIWHRVRVKGESRAAVARDMGLHKSWVARIAAGPA